MPVAPQLLGRLLARCGRLRLLTQAEGHASAVGCVKDSQSFRARSRRLDGGDGAVLRAEWSFDRPLIVANPPAGFTLFDVDGMSVQLRFVRPGLLGCRCRADGFSEQPGVGKPPNRFAMAT